jgi:hypothetical protein
MNILIGLEFHNTEREEVAISILKFKIKESGGKRGDLELVPMLSIN